jgi:hypothetical protein
MWNINYMKSRLFYLLYFSAVFLIGNLLFRFLPTKISMALMKRLRLDIRYSWEFERLYILGKIKNTIIKKYVIYIYYFLSPVKYGLAWGCAMESTFRIINLLSCVSIDKNKNKNKNWLTGFLLKEHLFIKQNLELHSNNNHYFFNVIGMLLTGDLLNESEYCYWLGELKNESSKQFYDDGGNFEASTNYHILMLDALSYLSIHNPALKSIVMSSINMPGAIGLMERFFYNSNSIWLIGDNDKSACTKSNSNSYRHEQYQRIMSEFGKYQDNKFTNFFPNFGFFSLKQKNGIHFCFWNIKHGQGGKCGHNHNDCLSISLAIETVPFIIDPGVNTYSLERDKYRGSACHSVPYFNSFEQERIIGKFKLESRLRREMSDNGSIVKGILLNKEIRLSREVDYRIDKTFIFEDEVILDQELSFSLIIASDIEVVIIDKEVCILSHKNTKYKIYISSFEPLVNIFLSSVIYSPDYGKQAAGKKIVFKSNSNKIKWSLKVV